MTNLDHILIFKTNIATPSDKEQLQPVLDSHGSIRQWNVDLHDCDFVLRIESETLGYQDVINLITNYGYECCELI